jgi:hypothetical protein
VNLLLVAVWEVRHTDEHWRANARHALAVAEATMLDQAANLEYHRNA